MQIDYALILSAGLGTRMGEIGKRIPKVLWPIYAKALLELQISYCKDLGIKKIYINTHFLHDEIEAFLKSHRLQSEVIILHENPLLNSGGAIHNLAEQADVSYHGNLLLVNGDQFLFFDQSDWEKAIERIEKCRAVLFGIKVDKNAQYNETILNGNRLIEIKKNITKDKDYVTYSGLGLLNLNGLKPVHGVSSFFETVANFKNEEVEFVTPRVCEYWDFGTAEIYAENIFKLSTPEAEETKMGTFLKLNGAFTMDKTLFVDNENKSIDLNKSGHFLPGMISGAGHLQKI